MIYRTKSKQVKAMKIKRILYKQEERELIPIHNWWLVEDINTGVQEVIIDYTFKELYEKA